MKTQRPLRKDSRTELFIKYIVNNGGKASVDELNLLLPENVKYKANFYLGVKDKPYHAYFKKNEDRTYSLSEKGEEYYNDYLKEETVDTTKTEPQSEPSLVINGLDLIKCLQENSNIILHGAPGTGKTFLAKEIAKKLCGIKTDEELKNSKQFKMVQFHPSYDYTDFVEGLRPRQVGDNIAFKRENGVFKEFCKEAIKQKNEPFVFLIDEINRGDMSKIFGELFYAIDPGYRGKKGEIPTQYQNLVPDEDDFKGGFYVPDNVYIIGTMNDIDRSVESMDFAMRRRFQFIEVTAESRAEGMKLKYKKEGEDDYTETNAYKRMTNLNNCIISKEIGLSKAYHIGGSYFLSNEKDPEGNRVPIKDNFENLWKYKLEGLLREYLRGEEESDVKKKITILERAFYLKDTYKYNQGKDEIEKVNKPASIANEEASETPNK